MTGAIGLLSDALMLTIATAVARWFEFAGIAAIVLGSLLAVVQVLRVLAKGMGSSDELIPAFRRTLGRSILTGLEFLVAADIIRTVAIEPTMRSVLVLGLIVLIRTFLSMSLEVEIDGKLPWRRAQDK